MASKDKMEYGQYIWEQCNTDMQYTSIRLTTEEQTTHIKLTKEKKRD